MGTYKTTVKRDGTVKFWNVYRQQWTVIPASDLLTTGAELLATLSEADRKRIQRAGETPDQKVSRLSAELGALECLDGLRDSKEYRKYKRLYRQYHYALQAPGRSV